MATGSQEPWRENLNAQLICHECREIPPNLVEEFSSGDMVCGSCGLILAEKTIDTRSEWRTFANDDQGNDDPSRVGDAANPLLDGSQLETSIAYERGGSGQSRDLHRAQNKSTHDKSNKSLAVAYRELGDLCESMDLTTNVTTYAKFLYKQIYDAGAFRGKPLESINAGLILIACRQQGVPRSFREIFHATKVPKADIGRTFKALEKFFANDKRAKNEKLEKEGVYVNPKDDYTTTQSTDPKELATRFCSKLNLPFRSSNIAVGIAERIDKLGLLAGRSPLSIVAACIYMASHIVGQPKSPKDIAAVASVSDGTIRHAYKLVFPRREDLVDKDLIEGGKGDISLLPAA